MCNHPFSGSGEFNSAGIKGVVSVKIITCVTIKVGTKKETLRGVALIRGGIIVLHDKFCNMNGE